MPKSIPIEYIRDTLCSTEDTFWQIFQALGDCARYRMVKALLHYRNLSVTDLAKISQISVPGASQQLKFLESSGIVIRKKSGRIVHYEIKESNPYLKKIVDVVDEHLDVLLGSKTPSVSK